MRPFTPLPLGKERSWMTWENPYSYFRTCLKGKNTGLMWRWRGRVDDVTSWFFLINVIIQESRVLTSTQVVMQGVLPNRGVMGDMKAIGKTVKEKRGVRVDGENWNQKVQDDRNHKKQTRGGSREEGWEGLWGLGGVVGLVNGCWRLDRCRVGCSCDTGELPSACKTPPVKIH